MNSIKYYFYYLDTQFSGFPLIIRIIVFVVMILVVMYVVSLLRFFFIARHIRKEDKRRAKIKKRYAEKFNDILFTDESVSISNIRSDLNFKEENLKDWEKKYISDLIVEIIRTKKELNINNFKNLLSSFSLIEFWEEELRVNDYKRNQSALRVLDDLGYHVPGSIISRKVHNINNELRKNAKSLSMKFSSYDSFKYLEDDFDKNLNELDKVRIHSALKENAKHKPLPLLIRWVKLSKNEKFKTFLIKEMGFFKQVEGCESLIEMFKDQGESILVKGQIAETLGELDYKKAVPVLIEQYDYSAPTVQSKIVDALGKLGGQASLDLLEKAFAETRNQDMIIKILENIYLADKDGLLLNKIKKSFRTNFEKEAIAYIESKKNIG